MNATVTSLLTQATTQSKSKRISVRAKVSLLAVAAFFGFSIQAPCALAQSLKPQAPSALQEGINKGSIDSEVGTHYWFFEANPGHVHVHCKFKSGGLLGNPYRTTAVFTLYDAANTWRTAKPLLSEGKETECDFDGDIKKPTKLMFSVSPPPNGLLRVGGDYEIVANGAVAFAQPSNEDPVVGMYKQMAGYTSLLGDCKFSADGSIQTTSGANGRWKVFDKDSRTYVIDVDGQDRHSLQLLPGRGLCDNGIALFQCIK